MSGHAWSGRSLARIPVRLHPPVDIISQQPPSERGGTSSGSCAVWQWSRSIDYFPLVTLVWPSTAKRQVGFLHDCTRRGLSIADSIATKKGRFDLFGTVQRGLRYHILKNALAQNTNTIIHHLKYNSPASLPDTNSKQRHHHHPSNHDRNETTQKIK